MINYRMSSASAPITGIQLASYQWRPIWALAALILSLEGSMSLIVLMSWNRNWNVSILELCALRPSLVDLYTYMHSESRLEPWLLLTIQTSLPRWTIHISQSKAKKKKNARRRAYEEFNVTTAIATPPYITQYYSVQPPLRHYMWRRCLHPQKPNATIYSDERNDDINQRFWWNLHANVKRYSRLLLPRAAYKFLLLAVCMRVRVCVRGYKCVFAPRPYARKQIGCNGRHLKCL